LWFSIYKGGPLRLKGTEYDFLLKMVVEFICQIDVDYNDFSACLCSVKNDLFIAAHGDGFGAKRNRKQTQRRAVDYTSTVVRYTQVR
jgi:hypothetical protein